MQSNRFMHSITFFKNHTRRTDISFFAYFVQKNDIYAKSPTSRLPGMFRILSGDRDFLRGSQSCRTGKKYSKKNAIIPEAEKKTADDQPA